MSDQNYQSYYGNETITQETYIPPLNPASYDDILKFSNCSGVTVRGLELIDDFDFHPQENWIDCVRGDNYVFEDLTIGPAGVAGVTLKGSITGYYLVRCRFARCEHREIEIGMFDDYWYPGRPPTRHGVLKDVCSTDGDPVRITLWDAEMPDVVGGNVKVTKVPKVLWFPYFMFRYLWIRVFGK